MKDLILRAQNGDNDALNTLIKENVGLVWNVVKRFSNRGYDLEDLYQIGCIGLIKAIKRFDVNFETQLSTYAVALIIGEIKRFLRDDGLIKVSRSLKENATKIREFLNENPDKDFSTEEISQILNIPVDDIITSLDATSLIESLDKPISEDSDSKAIGETIANSFNEYEVINNKLTINSLLNRLDEKEKKVIIYRYYKEMTQSRVAEIYGISQVQISRIEKKALEKMRSFIE